MQLKVLTYNIHKGFSVGNRRFVLDRIREALRQIAPDIIFLQEVVGVHSLHSRKVEKWPAAGQSEFLAEEFWPYFAYGKNAQYLYGHHGNALISRFPILEWSNIDISTNPIESRGILHTVTALPEGSLHCFCTHLNVFKRGRTNQVKQLCHALRDRVAHGERFLLAGDFNDWPGHASEHLRDGIGAEEVHRALTGKHAKTYPARLPVLSLDRMYCRGLETVTAEVLRGHPWQDLSDHLPLLAKLRM